MSLLEKIEQLLRARKVTEEICKKLEIEDFVVQSTPEVSPPKWHLAHTSWFFENFLLQDFKENYQPANQEYFKLFNSYYKSQGTHWKQEERGTLSRPTVSEVQHYRARINEELQSLASENFSNSEESKLSFLIDLGLHHEQQHQELLFMDIKRNLFEGPLFPKLKYPNQRLRFSPPQKLEFENFEAGNIEIGTNYEDQSFCYDNETPKHTTYLQDFSFANRLVTNQEYFDFINDGGYKKPELWKSNAWARLENTKESTPLYWIEQDGRFYEYDLDGLLELDPHAPVKHISFYEADAFARWKDCRLPTEQEWELVAKSPLSINHNCFLDLDNPFLSPSQEDKSIKQMHGVLWQWTSSSYDAYPGYKQEKGALGEYNGKFMDQQRVLRGGCYTTDLSHYRITYRNFYLAHQKWMFSGIRLAKDI